MSSPQVSFDEEIKELIVSITCMAADFKVFN